MGTMESEAITMSFTRKIERTQRWHHARMMRRSAVKGARDNARVRQEPQLSAGLLVSQWFRYLQKGGRRE